MYEVKFSATDSADWAQAIELIDNSINLPLTGIDDATFALEVDDRNGCRMLSASSGDPQMTRPAPHIVQWVFTPSEMSGLCPGSTYRVGLVMTTDTGTIQIILGSLAFLSGVVSQ